MSDESVPAGLTAAKPVVHNRRRSLIINPAAQRRFVVSICMPTLVMLLGVGLWAWWLEQHAYDVHQDLTDMGESSLPSFTPIGIGLFAAVMVYQLTVVFQALRVSHRIEGSAYNMRKAMERVRQGELDVIVTLRKKDHLQELAAELNRLIEWIGSARPAPTPGPTLAGGASRAAAPALPAGLETSADAR